MSTMKHLFLYSSCIILLCSFINNSIAASSDENNYENHHDNEKSTNLRRGRLLLQQTAPIRPTIFDHNNNDDDINNTSTTPLIEPYKEDPFTSNVNDFINTTHTTSQRITYTPTMSISPSSSPGPTWIQRSQPSNPTLSIPTAYNNNPPIDRTSYNNNDDTDFKEFIAFVGWYAFLILCCILPTVCTYYKRRRNAYLLNENIHSIRMRLEEMEQRNTIHGGGGLNTMIHSIGGIGGNEGSVIRLGERDQDWEFLEALFGSSSSTTNDAATTTNNTTTATSLVMNDAERRRQIMSDILGGMSSVRTIIEREQRRKRERGRRLVGLLKECSLEVNEYHLIPKEGGGDGGSRGGGGGIEGVVGGEYDVNNNEEKEEEEGDIELGTIHNVQKQNETDGVDNEYGDHDETLESNEDATVDKQSQVENDVDIKPSPIKGGDEENDVVEESCQHTNAVETNDEAEAANKVPDSAISTTPESTTTALQPTDQESDAINTQSSLLPSAVDNSTTTSSSNNNNILSLYQTDDILDDDDDEDNKYSALCVPCTPTHKDATTLSSVARSAPLPPPTIDNESLSTTRLVPPTCSICLISYSPGCYVTWSSNPACIHVFHRDCILVWLLKKEEPLCPCCRREFVSSSILNTETTTATTTNGGGGDNEDSVDQYRRTLERSRALAASRPSRRFARMSPNNPATASPWDSFDDVGLGRSPRSSTRRLARM